MLENNSVGDCIGPRCFHGESLRSPIGTRTHNKGSLSTDVSKHFLLFFALMGLFRLSHCGEPAGRMGRHKKKPRFLAARIPFFVYTESLAPSDLTVAGHHLLGLLSYRKVPSVHAALWFSAGGAMAKRLLSRLRGALLGWELYAHVWV